MAPPAGAESQSVFALGSATFYGSTGTTTLAQSLVGMARTPDGAGYWLVARDGGIFTYGDAGFHGSAGNIHLNKPIVGMAATPDGGGYWFVASDGGIFTFGDASFHGSAGNIHLSKPIVGMAATPDGGGYWLVASDGGIFTFGDASFHGSAGSIHLSQPIVGLASTPDGNGYWLVASDGGIFTYGDAGFHGSAGNIHLSKPIVGMAAAPDGGGYWFVASDGGVFNYGDARFSGSEGGAGLTEPIVGMTADPVGDGYWLVSTGHLPTPPVTFGSGTKRVGVDIPAGTYRTRNDSQGCYWERLRGFSGQESDIIANGLSDFHQVVTIAASDAGFNSSGCAAWTSNLSAITSSPTAPFSDGMWIVNTDIAPGTWQAPGGSNCYWERLRGFSGELGDVIANDLGTTNPVVTIGATDVGFNTSDCGSWTKIG